LTSNTAVLADGAFRGARSSKESVDIRLALFKFVAQFARRVLRACLDE
jgi:hypothetical protein